jgi:hypothetical protein
MSGASRAIARLGDDANGLGGFVAHHFRAFLSDARRRPLPSDGDEGPGSAEHRLAERLVAYCAGTGRRPGRSSNPVRILAEAQRWAREVRDAEGAEARLGAFLRRVRTLGLGEIVSVRELSGRTAWDLVEDLALPVWPYGDVSVRGMTVDHVNTATALAQEGERMRHCVATVLRDVMAGDLFVFAVRAGASRLTLALRPRPLEGYDVAELRGADDRTPCAAETAAVSRWVEAVNARARMANALGCITGDPRG